MHKTCVVLYEKGANLCCGVIDVSMHTWTACVCFCVLSYLCVRCCMHIIFICFRLVASDLFVFSSGSVVHKFVYIYIYIIDVLMMLYDIDACMHGLGRIDVWESTQIVACVHSYITSATSVPTR